MDLELLETQLAACTSATATEQLTINELTKELEDNPEVELQSFRDSAESRFFDQGQSGKFSNRN